MSNDIPPTQLEFDFGEDYKKEQVEIKRIRRIKKTKKIRRKLNDPLQLPLPLFDDN